MVVTAAGKTVEDLLAWQYLHAVADKRREIVAEAVGHLISDEWVSEVRAFLERTRGMKADEARRALQDFVVQAVHAPSQSLDRFC